jgi:SAM-dependent methyltransferase
VTRPDLWDRGDYPAVARRLEPAAAAIAVEAGPGNGRAALDVAAGTGSVALRLADAGWRTSATDGSPGMVARGREATARAGHETEWHVADVAGQPFDGASQDLVASSFGLIFAPDPVAAVAEVARILAPTGRLLLTTWTQDGYMARMTAEMARFLPAPPPEGPEPFRWGASDVLEELLGAHFEDVRITQHSLPWAFPSAAAGRGWVERASPGHIAAMTAAGASAGPMMDAVQAHLEGHADPSGRVFVEAEYLLVSACSGGRAAGRGRGTSPRPASSRPRQWRQGRN